jgi:hypothetical protein
MGDGGSWAARSAIMRSPSHLAQSSVTVESVEDSFLGISLFYYFIIYE